MGSINGLWGTSNHLQFLFVHQHSLWLMNIHLSHTLLAKLPLSFGSGVFVISGNGSLLWEKCAWRFRYDFCQIFVVLKLRFKVLHRHPISNHVGTAVFDVGLLSWLDSPKFFIPLSFLNFLFEIYRALCLLAFDAWPLLGEGGRAITVEVKTFLWGIIVGCISSQSLLGSELS